MALHRQHLLTAFGTTRVAALAGCHSLGAKHTTKLVRANGNEEDELGKSVAMAADSTTALPGAAEDQDPNGVDAGAAYAFDAAGGSWAQQTKPAAAAGDSRDNFGWSVAMTADGTTALAGGPRDKDPSCQRAETPLVGSDYRYDFRWRGHE